MTQPGSERDDSSMLLGRAHDAIAGLDLQVSASVGARYELDRDGEVAVT